MHIISLSLRLKVKVQAVREATEDEISNKSVDEGVVSILSTAPPSPHVH